MKAFKVYPFAIGAGFGSQVFLAEGSYFRVKTATGDVGVSFDDNTNLGPINAGQGFKVPEGYRRLTLNDMSGSANAGTIIVAGADFVDQQLSGVVQVIDGEQARALAGASFFGGAQAPAVAAQNSYCQLWNPAASGKNLVLQQALFSAPSAINLYAGFTNAALATFTAAGQSGKFESAAAGVGQVRTGSSAAVPAVAQWVGFTTAGGLLPWLPKGGLVIPPGWGFTVGTNTVNVSLFMNPEWYEIAQ